MILKAATKNLFNCLVMQLNNASTFNRDKDSIKLYFNEIIDSKNLLSTTTINLIL